MKKKLFFVLMICALTAVIAVILAGCGDTKLPSVRNLYVTENNYLGWGEVAGASGYVVYFNDDERERFYIETPYISMDNPEIRSVLKSGVQNKIYIRAVTLGKNNLPEKSSDRSMIIFNYSRKLSTPNKIKMSKDRFSWRGVNEATDYKAYVVRSGETEGTLYDMTWTTGTASMLGTINDLPNGYMYYVSIVATAPGYESSEPSDSVPYDRTVIDAGERSYSVQVGDAQYAMSAAFDDAAQYSAIVTLAAADQAKVVASTGAQYAADAVTEAGDYEVTFNADTQTVSLAAIPTYYVYVNASAEGKKLAYNNLNATYYLNVTFADGDTFVVKDGAGNVLSQYADDSTSQGLAATAGAYTIRVQSVGSAMTVSVAAGSSTEVTTVNPPSRDGQWAVTFDYNYDGAPAPQVIYTTDKKPVATPATPVRAGYIFEGWYEDAICLIGASFGPKQSNFRIFSPTTLYAKWSKESGVVEHTTHVDSDKDGKCDVCGATMTEHAVHVDSDKDGKCDVCGQTMPTVNCTTHIDRNGDGKCDNCGVNVDTVDVPVDTKAPIYLDVSDFAWFADAGAVINVHIWYEDGYKNTFPGDKMTYNSALGYYEATYVSSRKVKGVLFTRNNPNPNPAEGESTEWNRVEVAEGSFDSAYPVYKVLNIDDAGSTGSWIKVGEQVNTVGDGKIYIDFRDVDSLMENAPILAVYVWYTDGSENAKFPGKAVTYASHNGVKRFSAYVDYFTDKTVAGVIFSRNNPAVPLGDGVWNTIEFNPADDFLFDPAKPAYRVTLWGAAYAGYWESEEDALSPDAIVDKEDSTVNAYFYLDMSHITWFGDAGAVIRAIVRYEDGTVSDNAGVDGRYQGGYNGYKAVRSIDVLRINPATGQPWNQFTIELSAEANKDMVVVRALSDDGISYTYASHAEDVSGDEDRTLYFTNNKSWREVWVYAWNGTNSNADWPGVQLNQIELNGNGEGVFECTISAAYTNLIFNGKVGPDEDIKSVQTVNISLADLPANANGYFLYDTDDQGHYWYGTWWRGDAEEPQVETWDGTVTVDVTAFNDWFENDGATAYLYVWYPDGTNNGWCGQAMTKQSKGVYTIQLDPKKTIAGLIVARSSDGKIAHNQTGDLTLPDSHTITVTAWK